MLIWPWIGAALLAAPPVVRDLWTPSVADFPDDQFPVLVFPVSPDRTASHASGPVTINRALLIYPYQINDELFTFDQGGYSLSVDGDAFDLVVDPGHLQRYVEGLNAELGEGGMHDVEVRHTQTAEAVRFEVSLTDGDGLRNWYSYEVGAEGFRPLLWRGERAARPSPVGAWMVIGACATPVVLGAALVGVVLWRRVRSA